LLFHELATNATKYGALSSPDGIVVIKWDRQKGRVRLEWHERNGPPVVAPTRPALARAFSRRRFRLNTERLFNSNGACCTVSFALRD
jgi:two-component sensor histidine kinase